MIIPLCCPAIVAWSVKALVFHSVNSSPEQAVDRISLEAKSSCVDSLNKKGGLYAEWACGCVDSLNKKESSMQSGLQRCVLCSYGLSIA